MIIVLDAGHGAGKVHNRGATHYNEGDNNFYFSLELKKQLEAVGHVVRLTRKHIGENPSFTTRGAYGMGADLLLSLHSNAAAKSSVRGVEIWDSVTRRAPELPNKLCAVLAKQFDQPNRGLKYRKSSDGGNYYAILRRSQAKRSHIIEFCFHTNQQDCKFFRDHHYAIAKTVVDSIDAVFGMKGRTTPRALYYKKPTLKGEDVRALQTNLQKLGYVLVTDGSFGPVTHRVVKQFQEENGLAVDGSYGPASRAKMKELLP